MKDMLAVAGAVLLAIAPGHARAADTDAAAGAVAIEAATLSPNRYVWADSASNEPLRVVVSIPDQKAYVYRGKTLVAASTVSTGKDGKETPVGAFTILQKSETHKSNLYDAAPMPFMQRLTWDGVAIHAGNNPGFPASHGCIRVPMAFAKRLFAATSVGTPVVVTDESLGDGTTMPSIEDVPTYDTPQASPETIAETAAANAGQLEQIAGR
ncbi:MULTISPECIES: L,D-transpeptidase family protein [unclassified Sphingomonas]|jgi:lipoprotein-anchoring transpeptidase ErfK/SrfK|uniref:L,D-transpeptidase family protein n=1 Tax=unclassified Sphingomonas TaxID=196159 RepID=UPI000E104940|nr:MULTISPECIES: L,D-transpeptidase family protein [unclassified Sphingomonas]AXJ95605.1 hypothetical protein DM480_08870 [Sphingomonas sp. FARSPH]